MEQDLAMQVLKVLEQQKKMSQQQAEQVNRAVQLVDDLVNRGLAEPPTYKLATTPAPASARVR